VQHVTGETSTSAIDLTVEDDIFDDSQLDPPIFDPAKHTPSSALRREEIVTRPEVIRNTSNNTGDVSLRFDITRISAAWQHLRDRLSTACATASSSTAGDVPGSLRRVPSDAGVSNTENDDRAVDALARVIEKQDFATMDVVGQFNLGFIIARRRKTVAIADGPIDSAQASTDDLFIVDQHAADEKYNFETLQQTTSIKSQKLFR
jgi:DNA mismatch repair protein PMS2